MEGAVAFEFVTLLGPVNYVASTIDASMLSRDTGMKIPFIILRTNEYWTCEECLPLMWILFGIWFDDDDLGRP